MLLCLKSLTCCKKSVLLMTDWIEVLRDEVKKTSQRKVAVRLGVSAAQICEVLKGTYKGKLERLKDKVVSVYVGNTVICPVVGMIATEACRSHQAKPLSATNPLNVALFRACKRCPNNRSYHE